MTCLFCGKDRKHFIASADGVIMTDDHHVCTKCIKKMAIIWKKGFVAAVHTIVEHGFINRYCGTRPWNTVVNKEVAWKKTTFYRALEEAQEREHENES